MTNYLAPSKLEVKWVWSTRLSNSKVMDLSFLLAFLFDEIVEAGIFEQELGNADIAREISQAFILGEVRVMYVTCNAPSSSLKKAYSLLHLKRSNVGQDRLDDVDKLWIAKEKGQEEIDEAAQHDYCSRESCEWAFLESQLTWNASSRTRMLGRLALPKLVKTFRVCACVHNVDPRSAGTTKQRSPTMLFYDNISCEWLAHRRPISDLE